MINFRFPALACALAFTLSCGGDSSTDADTTANSATFTYTGARSGVFAATASGEAIDIPAALGGGNAVVGHVRIAPTDTTPAHIWFYAMEPAGAGRMNVLSFRVLATAGAHQTGVCATYFLTIRFGVPTTQGALANYWPPDASYWLDCSTVTVDELTATRFRGTFSGAAHLGNYTGTALQLGSGSFNIGVAPRAGLTSYLCALLAACAP